MSHHILPENITLTIIGCGKMGLAMLRGWMTVQGVERFNVVDPSPSDEFNNLKAQDARVRHFRRLSELFQSDDIKAPETTRHMLFLAVKPQLMNDVLNSIVEHSAQSHQMQPDWVVSIAAGVPISFYEVFFPQNTPIIRVMPNTPVAVGRGACVYCKNAKVDDLAISVLDALLAPLGGVYPLADESYMHAITALSGSGPAYIYALTEAMEKAGLKAGLPQDLATKLARQTVIGAAYLMEAEAETPAADLRNAVTSPGGTTAAALQEMQNNKDGIDNLMERAIAAAKDRSVQLSEF